MATREELQEALKRWAEAVKAAGLDPLESIQLNQEVAATLRELPDPGSNKGGAPNPLEAAIGHLEALE
jgi:hypothetical protein